MLLLHDCAVGRSNVPVKIFSTGPRPDFWRAARESGGLPQRSDGWEKGWYEGHFGKMRRVSQGISRAHAWQIVLLLRV
jgi:hypothetical protein